MSFDTKKATTAELVDKYNALSGKPPIKKFSSREAGERQLGKLLAAQPPEKKMKPNAVVTDLKVDGQPAVKVAKPARQPKTPKTPTERSEAIRRSWIDKAVHDARSVRTAVEADGVYYKSTTAAFRALRLPMGGVIKFRMALKAEKKKVFEHGDKSYAFKVVATRAKEEAK